MGGGGYLGSLYFPSGSIDVRRWDDTQKVLKHRERCQRSHQKSGPAMQEGDSRDSVMVYVISNGWAIAGK